MNSPVVLEMTCRAVVGRRVIGKVVERMVLTKVSHFKWAVMQLAILMCEGAVVATETALAASEEEKP